MFGSGSQFTQFMPRESYRNGYREPSTEFAWQCLGEPHLLPGNRQEEAIVQLGACPGLGPYPDGALGSDLEVLQRQEAYRQHGSGLNKTCSGCQPIGARQ